MTTRAIDNYKAFNNFKVNMSLFNQSYNKNNRNKSLLFGGSSANKNINMDQFLNILLPKLKGGYNDYKNNIHGGSDDTRSFNFIRDVMSPQSTFTNTNVLSDMKFRSFNYPLEQSLTRSSF